MSCNQTVKPVDCLIKWLRLARTIRPYQHLSTIGSWGLETMSQFSILNGNLQRQNLMYPAGFWTNRFPHRQLVQVIALLFAILWLWLMLRSHVRHKGTRGERLEHFQTLSANALYDAGIYIYWLRKLFFSIKPLSRRWGKHTLCFKRRVLYFKHIFRNWIFLCVQSHEPVMATLRCPKICQGNFKPSLSW